MLINTCSVREKAELKALGKMGMLCSQSVDRPWVVFGFMGCMVQSKARELFETVPRLDVVTGTHCYHRVFPLCDSLLKQRLASAVHSPLRKGAQLCEVEDLPDAHNRIRDHLPARTSCSAFVSIMQGCEMRCSYCIVPYTRGAERSRPAADILDEVRCLVDSGVKEITLLGQIVNRYGREEPVIDGRSGFVRLLEMVHEVDGLERLRFTSPHPIGFREDLVRAFSYLPKLCSHIHFPMQSGSDRILQLMRRPYKQQKYVELCEAMRVARPDLAITTDIIVGFPGETPEQVAETVDVVKKARFNGAFTFIYSKRTGTPAASMPEQVSEEDYLLTKAAVEQIKFDNAFIFQYSPRRGTPAADMPDQVCLREKEARNHDLLDTVNRIAIARNRALVGTQQVILVDGPSKTNPNRLQGRTSQNKPVIIEQGIAKVGELLPVTIRECTGFTLYGAV